MDDGESNVKCECGGILIYSYDKKQKYSVCPICNKLKIYNENNVDVNECKKVNILME